MTCLCGRNPRRLFQARCSAAATVIEARCYSDGRNMRRARRITMSRSTQSFVLAAAAACAAPASFAQNLPFTVTELANFDVPWAMAFLPDGRLLVTEQRGALKLHTPGGSVAEISGAPKVSYGGQGGLSEVVLHPKFADNDLVYLSYAEAGDGDTRGAAVARAKLDLGANGGKLTDLEVIWRQVPKVDGGGHYAHRIAFGADGYLWISSGDRQKFDP